MIKKVIKERKGITLIALVITIIVLLILAGVSIATLTGDNGILTQATKAKEQTEIAKEKEKIQLSLLASLSNEGKISKINLKENFKKNFGINKTKLIDDMEVDDIFYVKCEDTGRYYEITENREINLIEVPDGEKTLTLICVNSNNEELQRKDYTVLKNEYLKTLPSIDGYIPVQNKISGTITGNMEVTVKYYYVIDENQLIFTGLDSLGNITNNESEIVSYNTK